METITSNGHASDIVSLTPSNQRRLQRLHARAELAQEIAQQTHQALQEAITGLFEDAGIEVGQRDNFNVDWRTGTLSLRRQQEEQSWPTT